MQNAAVKTMLDSQAGKRLGHWGGLSIVVLIRVLFGTGWLLAGMTKILGEAGSSGHSWFTQPGVFITDYLIKALDKPNVAHFYKDFIEGTALNHITFLNYTIPLVQVTIGVFLILGLFTLPSICIALFMHINFLLSGNINLISLTLYTSAFLLLLNRRRMYTLSFDRLLKLERLFTRRSSKSNNAGMPDKNEASPQDSLMKFLQESTEQITSSVEKAQASQNERIEQFISYLQETYFKENGYVEQEHKNTPAIRKVK